MFIRFSHNVSLMASMRKALVVLALLVVMLQMASLPAMAAPQHAQQQQGQQQASQQQASQQQTNNQAPPIDKGQAQTQNTGGSVTDQLPKGNNSDPTRIPNADSGKDNGNNGNPNDGDQNTR